MNLVSPYRAMWLFALFDLPVKTKAERRDATRFRKDLIGNGFQMFQFSVYARYCGSETVADGCRRRIRRVLPAGGEVRLLAVTDKQFGKMDVFAGGKRRETEAIPKQLLLL
jgi:CRISPR-associated protein Cas2